jgi:protoporphyrinogen oxidase
MESIAVIGAGISGLSAAHFLRDRYKVTVFEKESIPGGLIKCKRINGSLFHTCGGHVFNSKRQDVLDWFWNIFIREDEFSKTDRNAVVFMEEGIEVPYPIENHVYMLPLEVQHKFIDDCLYIEKNKDKVPSNFEEFLKGRFGNTLYDLYFQPYNEKVWRRNLNTVPLSWLEGKLPMPTVHEMIFNNINHVKEKNFVHATFWYENKGGSQFIADKLAKGLDICYDTDIDSITLENGKWVIAGRTFDKVVFCGNIKDMVKSIRGVNLEAYIPKVNDLEYHGTTAVFCEIDKNPYSWIYQPSRKHESHRIICTGNFAKSNNDDSLPNDRITATVEFTDEISKEDILSNLAKLPLNPKYVEHKYNKYTYPIQNANTREMIKSLKSSLSKFEFYFTGRFADWEYYNMDVAVGAAMDLCKNI